MTGPRQPFTVRPATPGDDAAWDAFVATHPRASTYHQTVWRDLIASVFGHDSHYRLAVSEDGAIVGCLPLIEFRSRLFGHFLVSMPYFNYGGALGASSDVEHALMEDAGRLASGLGAAHVEFRDDVRRGESWPVREDKVNMHLALPGDKEALWKAVGSKVRAQVRRPQRESPRTVTGGEELLEDFYRVFSRNMRDLGTPVYGKPLFRAILAGYSASRIIVVYLGGRPAAAGFLVGWRGRLEIPWASSLREYNRLGVNMLLYWQVLEYAIEQGYDTFDFGRSTRDAGTYRFKRQWGAEPVPLYWHYWLGEGGELPSLSPSSPKFRLAVSLWQRLPVPMANLLGPGIVKSLP